MILRPNKARDPSAETNSSQSLEENVKIEVSVVLPGFNEAEAIVNVINDVRQAMNRAGFRYEIIMVDDGSSDGTGDLALQEAVIVIRHDQRSGAGAARRSGIAASKGDIIVMLDADGSYDAEDIPRLLTFIPEYDLVNGARRSEEGSLRFLRRPVKWLICRLASALCGEKIPDLNTGLKAFKRKMMEPFLIQLPDGFSCVTTMTLAFLRHGYAVKFVPVTYRKRVGKSKFRPLRDTFQYIATVVRMCKTSSPSART